MPSPLGFTWTASFPGCARAHRAPWRSRRKGTMPRRASIPGYDAGRATGDDKRRAAEKKRLSDSMLFRYRPYFVSGQMELKSVAELIADDLGVREPAERQKIAA